MKSNIFKKFFSVLASFSLALVFSMHFTSAAGNMINIGPYTFQAGEERLVGNPCSTINGKTNCASICDIDGTSGTATYYMSAGNVDTVFTMYLKENGKLIAEQQFTGEGSLEFDARKYKSVTFGLKNDMDTPSSFFGLLTADGFTCGAYSAASRVIAPFAAVLSALLFLF